MELINIASRRKSIREYSDEEINLKDVIYAIRVAKEAPSGANCQPWRFLIITSRERRKIIRKICEESEKEYHRRLPPELKNWLKAKGITWEKAFLEHAPVLILVFGNSKCPYWIQSVWLSIGYLILALEEKNLASLTYTPPKYRWANELFNVPRNYILQTIIPVGKPRSREVSSKDRFDIEEIVSCEEWGNKTCINPLIH